MLKESLTGPETDLWSRPDINWFAVRTRSNYEVKVFDGLGAKDVEVFLPRILVKSRRLDRKKIISVPLLPGYLFVNIRLSPEEHLKILKTVGVVHLVGIKGRPVPVGEEEIYNLKILDGTDRPVFHQDCLKKGDRVMLTEGPLQGLIGIFLRQKGAEDRVVVSVDFLNQAVAVEVSGWAVQKVA
ncbi:MAG: UpxY family transcription antiterminator [Pseudomonadota bacterium]